MRKLRSSLRWRMPFSQGKGAVYILSSSNLSSFCIKGLTVWLIMMAGSAAFSQTNISIDFGQPAYFPLIKDKGSTFQEGRPNKPTISAAMAPMSDLKQGAFRALVNQGGSNFIWKNGSNIQAARNTDYDLIANICHGNHMEPMFTLYQTPDAWLPAGATSSKVPPTNFVEYAEGIGKFVELYTNVKPIVWEVWNEPQNGNSFLITDNTIRDYNLIYENVAPEVRSADPDAVIAGPAMANTSSVIDAFSEAFLDNVRNKNLPLDYYSIHSYNRFGNGIDRLKDIIDVSRANLSNDFQTVPMIFTEYEQTPTGDNPDREFTIGAVRWLEDIDFFLEQTDIPIVTWNRYQFKGSGNSGGLVDDQQNRRPIYWAYKVFGDMPTERKELTINNAPNGLDGFASADESGAGILIWNNSNNTRSINLQTSNLPFSSGTVKLYRIDADHSSYLENSNNDNLSQIWSRNLSTLNNTTLSIPGPGIIYLEITPNTVPASPTMVSADYIRAWQFTARKSAGGIFQHYGHFDWNTWTGRMGVKTNTGRGMCGVTMDNTPSAVGFQFKTFDMNPANNNNALVAIRVDYMNGNNALKSVMLRSNIYNANRTSKLPWGDNVATGDVVINKGTAIGDNSIFDFNINQNAPNNWNNQRRVIISFIMENTGPESQGVARILQAGQETTSVPTGEIFIQHKSSGNKLHNNQNNNGDIVNTIAPTFTGDNVRWKLIPINDDPGYYRLEHKASGRWFHCQEDGITNFQLGPTSWTGERTKWTVVPVDNTFFRLEHKASGKWLHVGSDGTTNFSLGPTTFTGDNTQWEFISASSNRKAQVSEELNEGRLKAWPNPATGSNLVVEGLNKGERIRVFDLLGKLVYDGTASGETQKFDISDWGTGMFLLYVNALNQDQVLKILVK
ncbi:GH39 family glycosyl hydrolase [Pontibacter sp. G13]|uniref:GH39 family glycosyl hydrolase n=1 Tax=Pontibacter sp. G13 TaxID=3074898 RepID=UPI00288938D1|nr:T9SS type A sorting domain-containing protein [Pontibacter sp. G13]WNJ20646.1 T9SS type A sorting domain-containing protein [Pontibacter sp. G13]